MTTSSTQSPSSSRQNGGRRSFFWPAFISAFLLLSLASCGSIAALIGFDELSLADFQTSGPVWTPPAAGADAVAAGDPDATTEERQGQDAVDGSGRFQPGASVRNVSSSRVNIRQVPGHLGKPDSDVIAQLQPGDSVEIIGWPRHADNLIWWPVRFQIDGSTADGWVAESTAEGVQLLSPSP